MTALVSIAGAIILSLIAVHCYLHGMDSLTIFGLVASYTAAAFLIGYSVKSQIIQHDMLHDLKNDNHKIKNRFVECNQTINSMFDNISDGIALLNLQLDFFKTNQRFCDILGYTHEKILTWNLDELINHDPMSAHTIAINQLLSGKSDYYEFKKKITKKSGEAIWLSIRMVLIQDSHQQPHYIILYAHNLTHQKQAEEHLSYLKQHDAMLAIPNRAQFETFITQLLKTQNHQKKFSLLLLDLDNFKNINTTIGYEAGNIVLQVVAKRIKELIRSCDLLARLTSDEFAIVITDKANDASIRAYAEKILHAIAKPIAIKHGQHYLTASMGISVYPDDGFTTRKLMKHADIALHHVKCHEKNNYQFYSVEMARREKLEFRAKNMLANALADGKFNLHYQPRFTAHDRQLSCIQAHICLTSKNGVQYNPHDIQAYSDDTGLAMPITDWMISQACRQLAEWRRIVHPDIRLAIRFHAKYIKHQQLIDNLLMQMQDYQLPPHALSIEFQKFSDVVLHTQDNEIILNALTRLKQAGIDLILANDAINLLLTNQVNKYLFDKFIIHSDLTSQITLNESIASLVANLILIANEQHISCIATGIENENQASFLKKAGCEEIQGILLANELPRERMTEYLMGRMVKHEDIT